MFVGIAIKNMNVNNNIDDQPIIVTKKINTCLSTLAWVESLFVYLYNFLNYKVGDL